MEIIEVQSCVPLRDVTRVICSSSFQEKAILFILQTVNCEKWITRKEKAQAPSGYKLCFGFVSNKLATAGKVTNSEVRKH